MITEELAALVRQAIFAARDAGDLPLMDDNVTVALETPKNKQHGDYSRFAKANDQCVQFNANESRMFVWKVATHPANFDSTNSTC